MARLTIAGSGPQSASEMQVDPSFQAARTSLRPIDWNELGEVGGGHFFFESATGALTGVGANGPIASLRWVDSTHALVLLRCALVYYLTTAYTAPQMNDFELIRATGFTTSDSGGTAVTPARKRNSNMGNSLVGDLRVASTAALTAGVRTLDSVGIRAMADGPPNVAVPTATLAVSRSELILYDAKDHGNHPLVLGPNEGLILRMLTAMGAAGVIKAFIQADWAEVAQF